MLRRRINPLQSPLYRLTPDVFSEVASHLQSEADLIKLTRVSYCLRAALLSHPRLWTYIDLKHEGRAWVFLQRSKQAPLRVNMVKDDTQKSSLLYSHWERVVSLEMCNCAPQKEYVFSRPMPALRRLKIVGNDHEYDGRENDEFDWLEPAEDANLWSLPFVTSLIVHDVETIPLQVPHLTHFKLRDKEDSTNIDPLLEFLSNCPLLEHVDISYVSESSSSRNQLVSLPNLRTYTQPMYDEYYTLRLFNMLSLPSSCSVTSKCFHGYSNVKAADIVPPFRNPDYLVGITRIKLRVTRDAAGDRITGALEVVNAKGTKVCSERVVYLKRYHWSSSKDGVHDELNLAHLRCLQGLDVRSAEILCLEGYRLWDGKGRAVDTVKDALDCLRGVTTLVISATTVEPCLLALDMDPGAGGLLQQPSPVHTLIIHSTQAASWHTILQPLLKVARRRKAAGFPFRSVSLFLLHDPRSEQVLEELRGCIERLEVVTGDDVLGWNVDKYFLGGLDHLQERQNVQWD